jgi:hypothetical protein
MIYYTNPNDPSVAKAFNKQGVVIVRNFLGERFSSLKKQTQEYLAREIENKTIEVRSTGIEETLNRNNAELLPATNSGFDTLRKSTGTIINKRTKCRDGDDGLLDIWNIDEQLSQENVESLNKVKNYVLKLIKKSFNLECKFFTTNLYYNHSVSTTRGIHADCKDFPSRIKSFLYMTDINEIGDGPFSFILGSHYERGKSYYRRTDVTHPFKEDEDNYKIFDKAKEDDLIIACVAGAHRGMPQKPNHKRAAYVQTYDPLPGQRYVPKKEVMLL